jgi:hypothetical protein
MRRLLVWALLAMGSQVYCLRMGGGVNKFSG